MIGNIPPEITFDAADVSAYGAGDLEELLEALSPHVGGTDNGPPVVLLNGQRISGFREIRNYPPEAIERVDILPEEVALKYGYRADQRVVNFVLRPRFRSLTAELEGGLATDGGRGHYEADLTWLRIDRNGRWSIDSEYERNTALLESERDLVSALVQPFDLTGNVGAVTPGAEIDPALSALLGETVTLSGVPASALQGPPSLSEFGTAANQADERPYRTLIPADESFELEGTLNRALFGNISSTVNLAFEQESRASLLGLPSAELTLPAGNPFSPFGNDVLLYRSFDEPRPLTRNSRTRTAHGGLAFNGNLESWRWSLTANYDRAVGLTRTDTDPKTTLAQQRIDLGDLALNPFGPLDSVLVRGPRDRTRSVNESANAEFVANGDILYLPAGEVSTTFKLGGETRSFASETERGADIQTSDLSRRRLDAQASLDVPIASRRDDVLAFLGDLSANANVAVEEISDFGTLTTLGYGLDWEPIDEIRLIASVTEEDGAPSVQQLGNPVEFVPNVRVFDFTRGETVDVTRIEGGNPALRANSRRETRVRLTVRPLSETNLSVRADYRSARISDPTGSFPHATAEIEAAFPDRFQRNIEGRLVSVDSRPVNFARSDRAWFRWGANLFKQFGSGELPKSNDWRSRMREAERAVAAAAQQGGSPAPPQSGGGGPAIGPGATGMGGRESPPQAPRAAAGEAPASRAGHRSPTGFQGRLQFSLYHTVHLQDEIRIHDHLPPIDYLRGSASGNRGGRPRHEVEFEAGIFSQGLGARMNTEWRSATRVLVDPTLGEPLPGDLQFGSLTRVNLRLFANLGEHPAMAGRSRWFQGMRIRLNVDNLLNSRLRVRDRTGATPLGYQPAYLDPLGRSVQLQVRKAL